MKFNLSDDENENSFKVGSSEIITDYAFSPSPFLEGYGGEESWKDAETFTYQTPTQPHTPPYHCGYEGCECKNYSKNHFKENGFYVACLPEDSSFRDYTPVFMKPMTSAKEEGRLDPAALSKIKIGNYTNDDTRYFLQYSDVRNCSDKQYLDRVFGYVENEVGAFAHEIELGEIIPPSLNRPRFQGVIILSSPGGKAQPGHCDYETANGISALIALEDRSALDIILKSHLVDRDCDGSPIRPPEWTTGNPFTRIKIRKYHYIVFTGGLFHRGVGYGRRRNIRLHLYLDFKGYHREEDRVYYSMDFEKRYNNRRVNQRATSRRASGARRRRRRSNRSRTLKLL